MSQALILLIDHGGLDVWQAQGQVIRCVQHFPRDATGERDFGDFLGQHADRAFIAVTNLPGEHYHSENAPHLNRAERQRLHAERLQQHFPEHGWCCARQCRNPAQGDDLLCLMALDNSPEISSWMKLLRARGAALLALYSLAQGAPAFLRKRGAIPEQLLLLSRHDDQLRLTWLNQGQLQASRLQPLPDAAQLLMHCQHFLLEQSPEQPLNSPPAVLAIGLEQPVDCVWPDWQSLDTPPDATALYLTALHRRPPTEQFARDDERRRGQVYRQGRRVDALSLLFLGLALLVGCHLYFEMRAQQRSAAEAHGRLLEKQQKLAALQSEIASSPWPVDVLQQLQIDHDHLLMQHRALRNSLLLISRGLDEQADIVLDSLSWETEEIANADYGRPRLQIEARLPATSIEATQQAFLGLIRHLSAQSEVEIIRPPGQSPQPGRFVLRLKLRSTA
jgi:hypothetical protein